MYMPVCFCARGLCRANDVLTIYMRYGVLNMHKVCTEV